MSYASGTTPYPCNDPMVGIDRWPPMEAPEYGLRGPQVEPGASYWSSPPCPPPCVVTVAELTQWTDDPNHPCYFPPYPTGGTVDDELAELHALAQLRDDPEAVASNNLRRRRLGISQFLQLVPQPLGAVVNTERRRDSSLITTGPERLMAQVGPFTPPPFRPCDGRECCEEFFPVVRTGRELARYFEAETPGLAHRLALNYLLRDANFSPPYQALIWMALDVTIYSALLAAWYYKWQAGCSTPDDCKPQGEPRDGVSRRPRPIEVDYTIDVLYNREVNCSGSGDGPRRLLPQPSPGTPRHPSYPSGHSTYGAAASEILSYFFPDYAGEFRKLADNTGMARLWAGIHYRSDHVFGGQLGRCVAQLVINQLRASCLGRPDPCANPACDECPPTCDELGQCASKFCWCCSEKEKPMLPPTCPSSGGAAAAASAQELPAATDVDETSEEPPRSERRATPPVSGRATREQSRSPQQGAAPAGSSEAIREQSRGPQQGAPPAGSSDAVREQSRGPQQGAG
jgi:membrane-associated phospholipid phosphatase